MRDWRFTFMMVGVIAVYIFLGQQIFFPEHSQAILNAATDALRPSANIARAVYSSLLGN